MSEITNTLDLTTSDLQDPKCPHCGELLSIVDFDRGDLCGGTFVVVWKCVHCGTTGEDTYIKTKREYTVGGK